MKTAFKWDQPTRAQLKAARARLQAAIERAEDAKVVERSGGRCEVSEALRWNGNLIPVRCRHRAEEIHHLIGKWRLRGRGRSALSEAKLHCCRECHRAITEHRLIRVGDVEPNYTDPYERAAP